MADKIQIKLERMLPDLDSLVKMGLFKKNDIKKIIKKRRFYEYQLERKDVTKAEFFKAIKYEKILDKRRIAFKKAQNVKKVEPFEFCFVKRIIELFRSCLRKFKKDESIYMEYFNFLIKHKCNNIFNKDIGVCLLNNSANLDFWKLAAYNEFENNSNAIAARTYFQKCLRLNKKNISAYLEYFVFELKFVEKIVLRKKLLSQKSEEEKKLKFVNDVVEEEKEVISEEKNDNPKVEENEDLNDDVLNLKVSEIVWRRAVEAMAKSNEVVGLGTFSTFPRLIELDLRFLDALIKHGENLNRTPLQNIIIDHIKSVQNSHPDIPQVSVEVAINNCFLNSRNQDFLGKLLETYDKLLETSSSSSSNTETLTLLCSLIETITEKEGNLKNIQSAKDSIIERLIKYASKTQIVQTFSSDTTFTIVKFILECFFDSGKLPKEFANAIEEIVDVAFSFDSKKELKLVTLKNPNLLKNYFELYWKYLSAKNKDFDEIKMIFIRTLTQKIKGKLDLDYDLLKDYLSVILSFIREELSFFPDKFSAIFVEIVSIFSKIKVSNLSFSTWIVQELTRLLYKLILKRLNLSDNIFGLKLKLDNKSAEELKMIKSLSLKHLVNYERIKTCLLSEETALTEHQKKELKILL